MAQRAAIAVEIQNHRLVAFGGTCQSSTRSPSAVSTTPFRLRQAGRGRRRPIAVGKILQRALRDVEQRDEPAVEHEREGQVPFQRSHGPLIARLYLEFATAGPTDLDSKMDNARTRRVIAAGMIGNVLEWYDFAIYGYFASQIGRQFFPHEDAVAQLLSAFGVFALGYLMRPVGAR